MVRFECDYAAGAHPKVLQALVDTNLEEHPGYGTDPHCDRARALLQVTRCSLSPARTAS